MTESLHVGNYIITEPLINIVKKLKEKYPSQKLHEIKDKGSEIVITCVNVEHSNGEEKNPDAHINLDPAKAQVGTYHCFSCGTATDFIGFIALYFESSREYAKNWLIKNYGIPLGETILIDSDIKLPGPTKNRTSVVALPAEFKDYQAYCPYLQQRKISKKVCKDFNVKYDAKNREIVFPIYNQRNELIMIARRSIDRKFFRLTEGVEKPIYGFDHVVKQNITSVVATEGLFDCLTGWSYGVPTIAFLGNISREQIEKINKSCITTIYTMFDNDQAGKAFYTFLKTNLDKRIIVTRVPFSVKFKDINELDKNTFLDYLKTAKNS